MKQRRILLTAILLLPICLYCQDLAKHHLFVEGLGPGGYGSINYEYEGLRLTDDPKNEWRLTFSAGLSTYHLFDFESRFNPDLIIPLGVHLCWGNRHQVKGGIGVIPSAIVMATPNVKHRAFNTAFNLRVGYRYRIPVGKGKDLTIGLHYTPVLEYHRYFRHWGGIQIGYLF